MATLKLHSLVKRFGDVTAVNGVDLSVENGEFLCLLGPSGCGKTTALRMIAGFENPTAGDIFIDGMPVTAMPPNRRPTAMVFQQYTLWPHMSVFQNIAYGLRLRRLARAVVEEKVADGLDLVGLAGYEKRLPSQLSGGQQQRVALARALVLEPKILLLDEPFSSLDAALRVRLREELLRIQRQLGIATIFVTHDQEEALSLADRIALMQLGNIVQLDTPSELYAHPRNLFAAEFIGAMNLLPTHPSDPALGLDPRTLSLPPGMQGNASLTVAIRPEDFQVTVPSEPGMWTGEVEQTMDMGHYRKVLVTLAGASAPVKVFMAKSMEVRERQTIGLTPLRYLVYVEGSEPVEVVPDRPMPLA